MRVEGNTALITGGATGIGFSLGEALMKAGNRVIICGRRENKLKRAANKLPGLYTKVCDVSSQEERQMLCNWVEREFPDVNILVNNAGIQRMIDLRQGTTELLAGEDEIKTNLIAPIHLSAYFIPLLLRKREAAIINVSSGLGFMPIASMPVYCATKAAVHSFTMSLRHQLRKTSIKVFEVVPPVVNTELGRGSVIENENGHGGIPPSDVAKATLAALAEDEYEIVIGQARTLVMAARRNPRQAFQNLNER